MKRRGAFVVGGIHVGTARDQQSGHGGVLLAGHAVQGREAPWVPLVHAGRVVGQEPFHCGAVIEHCGVVQGGAVH